MPRRQGKAATGGNRRKWLSRSRRKRAGAKAESQKNGTRGRE